MKIATWSGRALLDVTVEAGRDRVWYVVAGFGTVTVLWHDPEQVTAYLGRWEGHPAGPFESGWRDMPDLPVLYGVRVYGTACCHVARDGEGWQITSDWNPDHEWSSIKTWRHSWLSGRSTHEGPPGTRKRATDVCIACVREFLRRPDAATLLHAKRVADALGRLSSARLRLERAQERLAAAQAEVDLAAGDVAEWEPLAKENQAIRLATERARVVRHFQPYTAEQRADRAASHRLGHRQRAAVGEHYYTHPDVPDVAFRTRTAAARAGLRAGLQ